MEVIKAEKTIQKDLTLATVEVTINAIKLNNKAFTKTVFNQIPIDKFSEYVYNYERDKLYDNNVLGEVTQISSNNLSQYILNHIGIQKVIAYCLIEKQGSIVKWYLYIDKKGDIKKTDKPASFYDAFNTKEQKIEFIKEYKTNFKKFNKYFDLINELPDGFYYDKYGSSKLATKEEVKIEWLNGNYCSYWKDEFIFENKLYSKYSTLTEKQKKDMVAVLNWFKLKCRQVIIPCFKQAKQVYIAV